MTYQRLSNPASGLSAEKARWYREHDHLPADVRDALVRYDERVSNGTIKPWDPDAPSYPEYDSWLTDWLGKRLPCWFIGSDT